MSEIASPCRLFVYLARDAPVGLVLRRGPSAWVQLTHWQTDSDSFTPGQWLRARVYERRCDLSPDGSLFASFVRHTSARVLASAGADSWLAVSRPPWFTALALWWIGSTYCAGGSFPSGSSLWLGGLTGPPDQGQLPPWLTLTKELLYLDHTPNWTERTVQFNRLLALGWTAHPAIDAPRPVWERRAPDGSATLVMRELSDADFQAYGGPHVVEYEVRTEAAPAVHSLGRATWADWDHQGRLVIAQGGRLLHWRAPGHVHELSDFNSLTPAPAPAPAEANQWPSTPT